MSEKKFLIIRLSAIGDVVHALPMAQVLREHFPSCRIDWVVGDACKGLIENNPLIDNCYSVPLSRWKKNWLSPKTIGEIAAFNKMLQKNKYDFAFDAHGMFKSAVILAFCGAKNRAAYSDYRELAPLAANVLVKARSKRPRTNYHVIKRHLDMLEDTLGITTDTPKAQLPPSGEEDKGYVYALLPHNEKPSIVFAPATTWENKHWEVTHWQELYDLLKNDTNIIFTGVEKDIKLIEKITRGCTQNTVLAGKTNMRQYVEVLRNAKVVVSPDSGASHLAFACNVEHIFTIFCATSKHTFAPPGEGHFAFPSSEPKCPPCHKRKCPNGHKECTKETSAKEVYEKILKIIS